MEHQKLRNAIIAAIDSYSVPDDIVCVSYEISKFSGFSEIRVAFQYEGREHTSSYVFVFGSDRTHKLEGEFKYMTKDELLIELKEEFKKVGVDFEKFI